MVGNDIIKRKNLINNSSTSQNILNAFKKNNTLYINNDHQHVTFIKKMY